MLEQDQTEAAEIAQLPRNKDGSIRKTFVKSVARRIEAGDASGLRDLVGDLHEADMGALIEALEPEQRPRLVSLLGIDFDFTALTEVDDAVRDEILDELPSQAVAKGVSELESDDAVAILEDLPKDEQAEILEQLPQTERVALTRSLDYPEESAGRRMQTEFIAVPPHWNVGQAIDYMRETTELPDHFYELYVVDEGGHFLGAVPLDRLLRSKRPVPILDLMEKDRPRVSAVQDQEEVARLFQRYNWVTAPVVDTGDRLVGGQLQKMVALAVLAPIVASQGGNATTQTMTVAVRALATRDLTDANAWRVIMRELMVGVFNGVAFAIITGVAAYVWFRVPGLGFVIGLAMICNLIAAALGGILIPLFLNRLKFDPAVASSPFVTTVTDVVGFFSFLSIASLWFGLR